MFFNKESQPQNQPLIEYGKKPFYMKLLPYEQLTYQVNFKPEEIINRLQRHTEEESYFRFKGILSSNNHRDFEGTVKLNSFNISRIVTKSKIPQIQAIGTVRGDLITLQ